MVKIAKKFFTVSVVAMTIMWSVGLAALVPTVAVAVDCPELEAGDLFKVPGNSAVYLLNADMERMYFPNSEVYHTWYADFSGVEEIPNTCVDAYPAPSVAPYGVNYRAGSRLVKVEISPSVYLVEPGNKKTKIGSEEVAVALYGANWASKVRDVADVYWPNFAAEGTEITTAALHNGMTVTVDGTTNYAVVDGMLYEVDGTASDVQTVSQALLDTLEMGATTVTAASLKANPAQTMASEGTPGDETTPVAGALTVSLAANTPSGATYPLSTPAVPFLTVNVKAGSADASVSGFTVMRTGLGAYGDLDKVWVEVDGMRKGSLRSVSSDNTANLTFGTSPVAISAGQTKSFTFYANLDTTSPTAGVANALKLTAVTSGGTVSGLPVTGNLISTGSVLGPTAQYDDVTVATAVSIGDQDATVGKIKITNNNTSEDIAVQGMTFKSIAPASGTKVDSDDISNFELFKGTTKVAGPVQMSSDSYVRFTLDNEVLIEKGGSKNETFTVKADVNEGPGRKIRLDVEYVSDLVIVGKNNNFRALPTSATYASQTITIGDTDLAISTDAINNPASRNVLKNTTQTLLKGYIDASKGEVEISAFRVTLTGNNIDMAGTNEYDNLRVYVAGVLVGEATADEISTSDAETSINVDFTDDFSVMGKKTLEVVIDVKDITETDWLYATISGSSGWTATRVSDGAAVTPGGSATGNKVSINASALTLALSATPVSATRVKGATTDLMGFTMAAGTADNVTVNSLTFAVSSTLGVEDDSDLTNIYLYKQGVTEPVAGPVNLNSSEQIVFSGLNLTVVAGETDKYTLKGTLAASFNDATLSDLWVLASDIEAVSSQGNDIAAVTGVDSAAINTAGTVKLTLVDRGTLDLDLSSATPDTHMVVANTTGDVNAKVVLNAEYEAVVVKKLTFTTVGTTANDDDIARVRLYNGSTLIGDKPGVNAGVVTFNLAAPYLTVPADGSVTLDLVTDYNSTVNSVADTGATIQWQIANFRTGVEADGQLNDVWAAINSASGAGVSMATTSVTTTLAEAVDATETAIDLTSATGINEGDLLLLDDDNSSSYTSGDEYVLVLSKSGNTVTVRRGVAGVTAGTVTSGDQVLVVTQALLANTSILYSNMPTLGYNSADQAAGTLAVGTSEVLKFTLSDSSVGEEDIKIEELLVRIDGTGMSTSSTIDWMISSASLYKDGKLVGTDADGLATSTGNLEFTSLDSDADSVIGVGSVFTVVVTVANTIAAGDTMRATIDAFGSATSAGVISGGDLDWLDTEGGSAVEWIQTSLTEIKGGLYQKLS